MTIDWQSKANAAHIGEAASLLLRRRGGGLEGGLESADETDGAAPNEQHRLDRLKDAIRSSAPAHADGSHAEITDKVVEGARTGLAKLNQGEGPQSFTLGEQIGLEAVILTGGERPSLFVRGGVIDLAAPDIGDWEGDLRRVKDSIRKITASVGRVDVPVRPWFAGTCFVIAEGLVVTNRHVLEAIAARDAAGSWTLNWPGETNVDFVAEDGATTSTKFKVTGVAFAGPDAIGNVVNFAHLDMAVLRVDPASDPAHTFPEAVAIESDVLQPKPHRDLYVVGFPGQPRTWSFGGTPMAGTETTEVMSSLFADKFGVKRLAPGSVKIAAGNVANDAKKWICAHDASTLGGNSGSCIVDLSGDGSRVVGLHFAGVNREQNWAHVASRLRDNLAAFSANFVT